MENKPWMVVVSGDGQTFAAFFVTLGAANDFRKNAVCGMGYRAQIYEWNPKEEAYELYME